MTRAAYYELSKAKARELRETYGLASAKVTLSDLRRIYKDQGIQIDYWRGPLKKVKGQYQRCDDGACVMVDAKLPDEQRIFTLAHELKHHFFDQPGSAVEADKDAVEIGAEIFAVELIFPDDDYIAAMAALGIVKGACSQADIVRLKHETQTTLSYASLAKRAERLGYAQPGLVKARGWLKLRDALYGEPVYKRVQRHRLARAARVRNSGQ